MDTSATQTTGGSSHERGPDNGASPTGPSLSPARRKVRLWLQYAGIALVALAYLGGMIGWSYASLNLEDDAAARPTSEELHVVKAGLTSGDYSAGIQSP